MRRISPYRGIALALLSACSLLLAYPAPATAVTPLTFSSTPSLAEGDQDDDGIPDDQDACPTEAGTAAYDGCPAPDSDGDGFADDVDQCPYDWGSADYNGCPIPDSDGDGVTDDLDQCPSDPGDYTNNGCPYWPDPDTDGDGLSDPSDACPADWGPLENGGCPWPDSDGDGVFDNDDACPWTYGDPANYGCPASPADSDGDGVDDASDHCVYEPGTMANNGCPEPVAVPAPTFADKCGTANDGVVIPSAVGVDYAVNGVATSPGTVTASGSVSVSAVAAFGYTLAAETTAWSKTFTATPCPRVGNVSVTSPAKDRVKIVNREAKAMTLVFGTRSVPVPANSSRTITVVAPRITWTAVWGFAPRLLPRTGALVVK